MKSIYGIQATTNLGKYLGLPIMVGKGKKKAFSEMKDRVALQLGAWNRRILSNEGKEAFIKTGVQLIPTYTMSCFLLPWSFCNEINGLISNYWWKQNNDTPRDALVKLEQTSKAKRYGRTGISRYVKF